MTSTNNSLSAAATIAPPNTSHNYHIASIPADGIGPEVVSAAIEVVLQLAKTMGTFSVEFTHIPWGTAYYKEHGKYVSDNVLEVLQSYDAALFGAVGAPVSKDFPNVKWDKMLVDAMTLRMVQHPEMLDTIVGSNLHMDILSDLAAGLTGSIGIAPSSNLDPTRKNPSLFEPVHGSAFDITGKGVANPVATFWSAAEMLGWIGEEEAQKNLMTCIEKVCEKGILTKDLGGSAMTQDVTKAVCEEIKNLAKTT